MSFRVVLFREILNKATSPQNLEPDWDSIYEICDWIRHGDVKPRTAVAAITNKAADRNPDVALFALQILETCVKECGTTMHDQIGTHEYMEQLRQLVKSSRDHNVETKILELIQTWACRFRHNSKYRAVEDTRNIMQTEGYKFPVSKDAATILSTDTSQKGVKCSRCHVIFDVVDEDNECSGCDRVFCDDCSDTMDTLGTFGVEVFPPLCVLCYGQIVNPSQGREGFMDDFFAQRLLEKPEKTVLELQEEEDVILAVAKTQEGYKPKEKKKKQSNSDLKSKTSTILETTNSQLPSPQPGPSRLQGKKLDKMPKMGDKRYEMSKTSIYSYTDVTEPSVQDETDNESSRISELLELIKAVSDKVDKLERDQKATSSCKSCGQSQTSDSSNSVDEKNLCFYHQNFGDKARKCMVSCPKYNTWEARRRW